MGLDAALAHNWRPTRRQWQRWGRLEPVLAEVTFEQVRAELHAARDGPRARADELLAALWRLSRGDRDAGRLLLACLVPAVRAVASGYRRRLGYEDAFTIATAATWDRIARFEPFDQYVAYRLQRLARRQVHRAAMAAANAAYCVPLTDQAALTGQPRGLPVLVLIGEAVDAGVVSQRGAWLSWATHGHGMDLTEAASLAGVSYEAAKKARQRADRALRVWMEDAA